MSVLNIVFMCVLTLICCFICPVDDPYDYQGRSFLHIPQDLDVNLRSDDPPLKCFIPKKCIHTWYVHVCTEY